MRAASSSGTRPPGLAAQAGAGCPRPGRRRLALGLCLVLLVAWQAGIYRNAESLDDTYRDRAAVGMCYRSWANYFYFYYFFDAFPLGFKPVPRVYTREGAEQALRVRGSELAMIFHTPCAVGLAGEYVRLLLFLPAAWVRGSPKAPTARPVAAGLFVLGLGALLVAFHRSRCLALGVILAILLGSHSFQLFETYSNRNVFSFTISSILLALALNLRFLRDAVEPARGDWLLALGTGIFLGTAREVRAEAALGILSVLVALLLVRDFPWARRTALVGLLLGSFFGTAAGWSGYFDRRYEKALALVEAYGGRPYQGRRNDHHTLWHPIFCGLADFGADRGYVWDDRHAFDYAIPILNSVFGLDLFYGGDYYFYRSADIGRRHPIKADNLPEYDQVLRAHVLSEIRSSPGWYAGILARRLVRVLTETTPVGIHWIGGTLPIPFPGWLALPLLAWFWLRRQWFLAKLLLFTAPLSLLPLLIYSGEGTTYYAVFPGVALAIAAWQAGRGIRLARARTQRSTPPGW